MKVQIRDREALSSISIVNIRAYLNSHGWTDAGTWGDRAITIFAKEHGGRTWEILVPHRDTIGGYAENMANSVAVLSAVEERSELDVFYDLSAAGADVIQIRSANGKARELMSLRRSAEMLNDAYRMLAAAAMSAEQPKAAYRGELSSNVVEYLESVYPLPSYPQNYALTLHSPVSAEFDRQEDSGDDIHTPFGRLATIHLAQGLRHTSKALARAVSEDALEPFKEAAEFGVSADLCDSVANLAKRGNGITIDLTWASVCPSGASDSSFQFSQTSADILMEAARTFRLKEPSYGDRYELRHPRNPSVLSGE